MIRNYYEGSVPMKAEVEKKDFMSEDEFCYQMPKMYFECTGEVYDSQSVFQWSDDSLIVMKDNYIVKYTESKFRDVLVKDVNGESAWMGCRLADVCGFTDQDVEDSIERKRYVVEEYDLDKAEKRTYSVILKRTAGMSDTDQREVQRLIDKLTVHGITESVLTDD